MQWQFGMSRFRPRTEALVKLVIGEDGYHGDGGGGGCGVDGDGGGDEHSFGGGDDKIGGGGIEYDHIVVVELVVMV